MKTNKKIYFASDAHFGFPDYESSLKREKLFVKWLDEIKHDAAEIFLMGDIFDYWYEYEHVVPRGHVRLLGKLAEITDAGIPIHFFTGNHDIWVFDYLPKETGVKVYRKPHIRDINGKRFYLAHGDGLGPFDRRFKMLKCFFTNPVAQWFYSKIHPNYTISFAKSWSRRRRKADRYPKFYGENKEWLVIYAKQLLEKDNFDYFIFGHRHMAMEINLPENCKFYYLGDWLVLFSYAVFDGDKVRLKKYIE